MHHSRFRKRHKDLVRCDPAAAHFVLCPTTRQTCLLLSLFSVARFSSPTVAMPPFGFDNDRVGLLQTTFSEDIDSHRSNGIDSGALKNVLHRFEEDLGELGNSLRDVFQRASEFSQNMHTDESRHVLMGKAADGTIRIVLAEILDQVAMLLELEGSRRRVVADLTHFSISQALHYFDRLESKIQVTDHEKLKPFLEDFSRLQEGNRPIRLSFTSRALAFEFVAGLVDTTVLSPSDECSLGLRVVATPYLVVKTDAVAGQNDILQKYSDCKVMVDSCSHKKLFTSSGSGIMGEATVRIYVNPGKVVKIPKEGKVWGQAGECDTLDIVQVRAVQTNAYPRNVQTKLDLYLATMHGLSGFIVTLKMKTYKSFRNEVPAFDIQLVMQPASITHG